MSLRHREYCDKKLTDVFVHCLVLLLFELYFEYILSLLCEFILKFTLKFLECIQL